jgi:cytochrome b6-f complex iron-sulfur subunit
MTRRDLIQKVLIGGTSLIILPTALNSCSKDDPPDTGGNGGNDEINIDLTNPTYAALNNVGGSAIVQGIIVANTSTGYVALDSVCTHQGCTIGYSSTNNNFPCPCHGSVYSTTGAVINGPATAAVKSYAISKSGNILTITL